MEKWVILKALLSKAFKITFPSGVAILKFKI